MFMMMIGGISAGEWHSENAASRLLEIGYRPMRIRVGVPFQDVVDDELVYVHKSIPDDGVLAHLFKFYERAP